MAKNFSFSDVVAECSWSATAYSEEELMKQIQEHAKKHGFNEVTPELAEKIKAVIKDQ